MEGASGVIRRTGARLRRWVLPLAAGVVGLGWVLYVCSFAVLGWVVYAPADVRGSGLSAGCPEVWCGNGVLKVSLTGDTPTALRLNPPFRTAWSLQLIAAPAWREGIARARGNATIDWDKSYGRLRLSAWTYPWPDEVRGVRTQVWPSYSYQVATSPPWIRQVAVPLWPVMLAATSVVVWRWRRRVRLAAGGVCRGCGYSLTGLAAGAVCPECGAGRVGMANEA